MTAQPDERFIVIPKWEDFQHRDAARVLVPTWIKFMTRLLSNEAYLSLTGHRRAILHGIWLEYARSLRELPDNTTTLSRRLALKVTRRDLQALNHAGFIHFSASTPASNDASMVAGTEKRREVQVRAVHSPLQDPAAEAEPSLDDEPSLTNGTALGSHPRTQIARSLAQTRGAA